jgi:SAM-dependent methyltransferase
VIYDPRRMSGNSYDELPYADYCFPRTHPEHLSAVSALCGRASPPFARCRVLELGCARGANLLPMALDLPGSEFVGVDLSEGQIAEARRRAEALGLANVSFRAESITALSDDAPFDYVICHGVYSWVPPSVRDAILDMCRERMRPEGVAYLSFNALPGWNGLRTIRDFLREHAPPGPALQRVALARRALAVLDESLRAEPSPWSAWLRAELQELAHAEDAYLFHEHLEPVNDAVYLRDFVAHARAHGLAQLADADLRIAAPALRPGAGDPLALAQSVDFTRNRRFRASLLVPAGTAAGRADPASLARLHLATRARLPAADASALTGDRAVTFPCDEGPMVLRDPWMKCAMHALASEDRRPVSYAAMAASAAARLGMDRRAALVAAAAHAPDVLELLFDGAVTLHAGPARYAEAAGLRPLASAIARMQAQTSDVVTTLRHTRIELPHEALAVLRLSDGTRDRAALIAGLPRDGRSDAQRAGDCEEALDWLASNALLTG